MSARDRQNEAQRREDAGHGPAGAVRFMRHYVTNGTTKARVHYSLGNRYAPGGGIDPNPCVTLYAQDYSGALGKVLPAEYHNDTDSQSDYFDKGHCDIPQGHPLFAAARQRCEENAAAWAAHVEKRNAKRAERQRAKNEARDSVLAMQRERRDLERGAKLSQLGRIANGCTEARAHYVGNDTTGEDFDGDGGGS